LGKEKRIRSVEAVSLACEGKKKRRAQVRGPKGRCTKPITERKNVTAAFTPPSVDGGGGGISPPSGDGRPRSLRPVARVPNEKPPRAAGRRHWATSCRPTPDHAVDNRVDGRDYRFANSQYGLRKPERPFAAFAVSSKKKVPMAAKFSRGGVSELCEKPGTLTACFFFFGPADT